MKQSKIAATAVAAGAIVALFVGVLGGQALAAVLPAGSVPDARALESLPPVATNENGQTYGSIVQAKSADDIPDLIRVIGDNGREGYVYESEYNTPPPASPEEALRLSGQVIVLRVYLADGETVVDTFTIGGGTIEILSK